jgi:RloB-like protein
MKKNRVVKPVFALLVDGECEFWYFQMLKRNERALRVDLKPEIPQKKKLEDQFKKIVEYSSDYDKVFWIVDFDVLISESRVAAKGKKTALQEFKGYYHHLNKNYKNVVILINNPCFEFWLLLHFEATGKFFETCEEAAKKLLKYLPDYEKTEKYYTKWNHDLYLKLKPNLKTALENAQKLGAFDFENPAAAMAEMYLFFGNKNIK